MGDIMKKCRAEYDSWWDEDVNAPPKEVARSALRKNITRVGNLFLWTYMVTYLSSHVFDFLPGVKNIAWTPKYVLYMVAGSMMVMPGDGFDFAPISVADPDSVWNKGRRLVLINSANNMLAAVAGAVLCKSLTHLIVVIHDS